MDDLRYTRAEREYLASKGVALNDTRPVNWFYWQAYHHLSGSRPVSFSIGAIPFSEIAAYSDWLGLTCPVERSRLVRMVMAMDRAEREHHARTSPRH